MSVPLTYFLMLAAAVFCIGLYGALVRRNAVGILMALELMLNAVNINLVAFSRSITPDAADWPDLRHLRHCYRRRRGSRGPGHHHRSLSHAQEHQR